MKKGAAAVFASYVLWGLLPVFWKMFSSLDPVYILAIRIFWSFVFAAVTLAAGRGLPEIRELFRHRKNALYLAACGLFVCINWGVYVYAVNNGRILDTSLAYYLSPVLSVLIGSAVFHEKLSPLQWISVLTAFIGVMVPVVASGTVPYLSLIISGSFTIYGAMKKKVKAGVVSSLFMEMLPVMPFALVFILLAETHGSGSLGTFSGWQFLLPPAAGIVTSAPLLLFSKGVKAVPYSMTGILMYINPTLQLLLGVFLYGEKFTTVNALMFAFVWAALVLFFIGGRKKYSKP